MKSKKAKAATKRGVVSAPGCSTCRYSFTWKKERPVDFSGTMIPYNVMWECRRHSVTTDGFPTTRADWWCGDYESNPNFQAGGTL